MICASTCCKCSKMFQLDGYLQRHAEWCTQKHVWCTYEYTCQDKGETRGGGCLTNMYCTDRKLKITLFRFYICVTLNTKFYYWIKMGCLYPITSHWYLVIGFPVLKHRDHQRLPLTSHKPTMCRYSTRDVNTHMHAYAHSFTYNK